MTEADIQSQLDEARSIIGQQMEEIDRLRAVVAKMTGTDDAHSTLRRIYLDEAQPSGTRVKAAQAALNVEKPRLESVPPPLELVAEEIEPLAQLVERQRARARKMLAEDPQFLAVRHHQVALPKGNGGSSDGDDQS